MRLYSATELSSWSSVTNMPFNSGSNLSLTLPASASGAFFRLQWP
jgi:hypothetical protein